MSEGAEEMTGSQQSAVAAALTQLGYPVTGTVTVRSVGKGTAAAGVVRTGDVVQSFAGHPVVDSCGAAGRRARARHVPHPDQPRALAAARAPRRSRRGSPTSATARSARCSASRPRPRYRFPFPVKLQLANVGRARPPG